MHTLIHAFSTSTAAVVCQAPPRVLGAGRGGAPGFRAPWVCMKVTQPQCGSVYGAGSTELGQGRRGGEVTVS